jgi:hypothetical protein
LKACCVPYYSEKRSFGRIETFVQILPEVNGSFSYKELFYTIRNKYISEGTMIGAFFPTKIFLQGLRSPFGNNDPGYECAYIFHTQRFRTSGDGPTDKWQ